MAQPKPNQSYEQLIAECDQLLKAGRIGAVSSLISKLPFAQIPRKERQSLAKICRRAGLIHHGLRLLQPVIRNETKDRESASLSEICEYAILLSRNGSVQEALKLLQEQKINETPDWLLSLAYCHMAQWEYTKVVPLLEKLLKANTDSYLNLIARVNLASAYLATSQLEEAFQLTSETIALAEQTKAARLAANCLEIRGQVHFYKNDFAKARADLNRATEVFGSTPIYDQVFISQWQATMTAIEKNSVEPLIEFRKEAIQRKLWESVREADLFTLKVRFDQKLYDHLTLGTPMPGYRQRIQDFLQRPASTSFIYGQENAPLLDIQTGHISGHRDQSSGFNVEKKIHHLLSALLRDFYVPRNMGSLFSELYPDEFFNINSSPSRVNQLISRTRKWLKAHDLPIAIDHSDGTYQLRIQGQFGIKVHLAQNSDIRAPSTNWLQLKNQFKTDQVFSAKEACDKLQWSRSLFLLVAEDALKAGELLKSGAGKATRYWVAEATQNEIKKPAA